MTVVLSVAVNAKPVTYVLPDETAAFKPADRISKSSRESAGRLPFRADSGVALTQPQGPAFKKAFWEAEVTKMIKVYGAPIDEADVPKIVDYLTQVYYRRPHGAMALAHFSDHRCNGKKSRSSSWPNDVRR